MKSIRAIAICVFRRGGRILAFRSGQPGTTEEFFRPFGGGLEFGELAEEAIVREIHEELGESIVKVERLGVLESRFDYSGQPQHELLFVFDAEFRNSALYGQGTLVGKESNGKELIGEWVDLHEVHNGPIPLYPEGLRELILRSSGPHWGS
ncbi:MAG: NUDIX domain-containing protein [Planctomycetes bacterium]|nr:NUDIX domain-containing protein [Planctomycetota bacterium]